MGKFIVSLLVILASSGVLLTADGQQKLKYSDYVVESGTSSESNLSYFTIRRGSRLLARHSIDLIKNATKIELVDLLGNNRKQLFVKQYTGGNHCCHVIRIYDLGARLRLLFKSDDYNLLSQRGFRFREFKNLDLDTHQELVAESYAFAYFDGLPWVSSPMPQLVFDYNPRRQRFELANRKFAKYLLEDVSARIEEARKARDSEPSTYAVYMFSIYVDMIYAGNEKAANGLYYRDQFLKSKSLLHDRNMVLQTLRQDGAYRTIYKDH